MQLRSTHIHQRWCNVALPQLLRRGSCGARRIQRGSMVAGQMNKVIVYELNITTRTVETHRSHLMVKTEAGCLADLLRFAQQLDLLS